MEAFSNDIWFIHVQVPESMLAHIHTQHKTHSCTQAHIKKYIKAHTHINYSFFEI